MAGPCGSGGSEPSGQAADLVEGGPSDADQRPAGPAPREGGRGDRPVLGAGVEHRRVSDHAPAAEDRQRCRVLGRVDAGRVAICPGVCSADTDADGQPGNARDRRFPAGTAGRDAARSAGISGRVLRYIDRRSCARIFSKATGILRRFAGVRRWPITSRRTFRSMMRSRRPLARLVMLVAVSTATLAGCGNGPRSFSDQDRSWALAPPEVPMPPAAPDDPSAYRGVRFRTVFNRAGGDSVETVGRVVPWLRAFSGSYTTADSGRAFFGDQQVYDGRRHMMWFVRLVEPPATAPPPLSTEAGPPPGPQMAVLDVLVLHDGPPELGRFRQGCGPDTVIIVGDNGWRLNRSTGRIGPIDPDDADCPDD